VLAVKKSVSEAERARLPTAVGGARPRASGNFLAGEIDRVFSGSAATIVMRVSYTKLDTYKQCPRTKSNQVELDRVILAVLS